MLKIGPGTVIGEAYLIERLLGRGGMGSVYAGLEIASGRKVAVKVLEAQLVGDDELLLRFKREATASSAVNHDGVVKVLASGTDDATPYLVMELLEGETLAQRLQAHGPFTVGQTVAVLSAVLEVLEAAHRAGVVHRDLKPPNIFLARSPRQAIKVLDFGISLLGKATTRITRAGTMMGTLGYMSPEQVRDTSSADRASDLFAVGAIAFELLSGRLPFTGQTQLAFMQQIVEQPAPAVTSLVPGVPPKLERLIDQLLAKSPADRPSGATTVRLALLEIAEPDFDGLFRPISRPAVITAPGSVDTGGFGATGQRATPYRSAPAPAPPTRPDSAALATPARASRWPWAVAGAAALALAGGAVVMRGTPAGSGAVATPPVARAEPAPAAKAAAPAPVPVAVTAPAAAAEPAPAAAPVPNAAAALCEALCIEAQQQLPKHPEVALLELNHCIVSNPGYADAYRISAHALEALGIGEGRRELYSLYLQNTAEDDPLRAQMTYLRNTAMAASSPAPAVEGALGAAVKALARHDSAEALGAASSCVGQDFEIGGCHLVLGALYAQQGKVDQEAREDLLGLTLSPGGSQAEFARARLDSVYEELLAKAKSGALKVRLPPIPRRRYANAVTQLWDVGESMQRCVNLQQLNSDIVHGTAKVSFQVVAGRAKVVDLAPGPGAEMAACLKQTFDEIQFVGDSGKQVLVAEAKY